MRFLSAAALCFLLAGLAPAEAGGRRDGFGWRSGAGCRCDRYLNPHFTGDGRYGSRRPRERPRAYGYGSSAPYGYGLPYPSTSIH